jgi:agmatine deiminase
LKAGNRPDLRDNNQKQSVTRLAGVNSWILLRADANPLLTDPLNLTYLDRGDNILERGNLEANGVDTIVLNWDCQLDRNPDFSKEDTADLFRERFGADKVVWVHGHDPEDFTTGHIDGILRFVDPGTVAVARSLIPGDPNAKDMDDAADTMAHSGFDVVRMDVPGTVPYKGEQLPVMYMNWLLGNGFVAAMAFGNPDWDAAAKATPQDLFPNRTIHMIETLELWANGGGIHCVTNDQPK